MADETHAPTSETEVPVAEKAAEAVPASEKSDSKKPFKAVKEIANKKGAEVVVHTDEVFGRPQQGADGPVRRLFNQLVPELQQGLQQDGQTLPSHIASGLNVACDDQPGRPPRLVISAGPAVYVIVSAQGDELEAQLYAHIPAEVNNLVVPKLTNLGVKISASTFIRPSAL